MWVLIFLFDIICFAWCRAALVWILCVNLRLFCAPWRAGMEQHLLRGQQHVLPRVQLAGVRVLPVQVLAHGFGGKFRLTDVAKVPSQVDRLTWTQEKVNKETGSCISAPASRGRTAHRRAAYLLPERWGAWRWQLCASLRVNSGRSSPAFPADTSLRFSTWLCGKKRL